MKKFFGKLPVMIIFVVLAVLVLALNIGMIARPISYGMTYKGKMDLGSGTVEATIKFKNDKLAKAKSEVLGVTMEIDVWVVRNGYKVAVIGVKSDAEEAGVIKDEAAYDAYVKAMKKNKEAWDAFWNDDSEESMVVNTNAYRIGDSKEHMTCAGAIIYTVVMSLVEVALITFAIFSVVYFVQTKKTTKTAKA